VGNVIVAEVDIVAVKVLVVTSDVKLCADALPVRVQSVVFSQANQKLMWNHPIGMSDESNRGCWNISMVEVIHGPKDATQRIATYIASGPESGCWEARSAWTREPMQESCRARIRKTKKLLGIAILEKVMVIVRLQNEERQGGRGEVVCV